MRYVKRLSIAILYLSALACTNAVPVSTGSNMSFSAPKFSDGQTQKVFVITNYTDPITVSGTCDANTKLVEISFDDGVTWQLPTNGSDLDCNGDGTFSFQFTNCSNSGVAGAIGAYVPNGVYGFVSAVDYRSIKVTLRSQASLSASIESIFYVQYGNSLRVAYASLSAGGKSQINGTNYKIRDARIAAPVGTNSMSSANYIIKHGSY